MSYLHSGLVTGLWPLHFLLSENIWVSYSDCHYKLISTKITKANMLAVSILHFNSWTTYFLARIAPHPTQDMTFLFSGFWCLLYQWSWYATPGPPQHHLSVQRKHIFVPNFWKQNIWGPDFSVLTSSSDDSCIHWILRSTSFLKYWPTALCSHILS